ncbi:hypothetical protein H6F61_19305 [Cyanobacteria bacterium FACHB-472]|nr:hypothetical protein [Cyanobacteria bacterium FACHB-472]
MKPVILLGLWAMSQMSHTFDTNPHSLSPDALKVCHLTPVKIIACVVTCSCGRVDVFTACTFIALITPEIY